MEAINDEQSKKSNFSHEKFVKTKQECEYCGNIYIPTRRFVQKYCSKSCRVMAYIKPENKIGSQMPAKELDKHEETGQTIVEKQKDIAQQKELLREVINEALDNKIKEIKEAEEKIIKRINLIEKDFRARFSKITNRQEYHIAISLILPFVAKPLQQRFISMANTNNPPKTYEEFISNVEPYLKTVSPEVREQIINGAKAFYNLGRKG